MNLRARMAMAIDEPTVEAEKVTISRTLVITSGISEAITVKQRDHNSRVLELTLRKTVISPLDLSNSTLYLIVKKPDNTTVKLQGVITNTLNGVVEFSFTKESLSLSGTAKCEVVRLGQDGTTLSFPSFDLTIQESIYNDFMFTIEDEEFTAIENVVPMQRILE